MGGDVKETLKNTGQQGKVKTGIMGRSAAHFSGLLYNVMVQGGLPKLMYLFGNLACVKFGKIYY